MKLFSIDASGDWTFVMDIDGADLDLAEWHFTDLEDRGLWPENAGAGLVVGEDRLVYTDYWEVA